MERSKALYFVFILLIVYDVFIVDVHAEGKGGNDVTVKKVKIGRGKNLDVNFVSYYFVFYEFYFVFYEFRKQI